MILEYGSGGSTVLAAGQPGKFVMSVECDFDWALAMRRHLDAMDGGRGPASPVVLHHVDIGATGDWGRPLDSSDWQKFHLYPTRVWDEPFFRAPDLMLIDGRFRPACFVTACLRTTRPLRVLFDDYRDRPQYHGVERLARPARMVGRMAEFEIAPRVYDPQEITRAIAEFSVTSYARK